MTAKTLSKFRVIHKMQVVRQFGSDHILLSQMNAGALHRFFVVSKDFQSLLKDNPSIGVDAELQKDIRTGQVTVTRYNDFSIPDELIFVEEQRTS